MGNDGWRRALKNHRANRGRGRTAVAPRDPVHGISLLVSAIPIPWPVSGLTSGMFGHPDATPSHEPVLTVASCRVLTRLPLRGQRRLSSVIMGEGTGFPFNRWVKATKRHRGIKGGY
jgi:hypothetical protein